MKVKELKEILNGISDDLTVTVADYDDDSDGVTLFKKPDGCEQVGNKAVIFFQEETK